MKVRYKADRKVQLWLFAGMVASTLAVSQTVNAQEAPPIAARIHFTGVVFWCAKMPHLGAQSKTLPSNCRVLDSKKEQWLALHGAEAVKCDTGAHLVLVFQGGDKVERTGQQGWYPIPKPSQTRSAARSDLDGWSTAGGILRGNGSILLWPTRNCVIRPERLTVRWRANSGSSLVMVIRNAASGEKICCNPDLTSPADSGSLASEAIREALTTYRDSGRQDKLELTLETGDSDVAGRAQFQVLTADREREVQKELATWNKIADPLLAHAARAGVYRRNNLFEEAAYEYGAALAADPGSTELLENAIAANDLVGRLEIVERLKAALKAR